MKKKRNAFNEFSVANSAFYALLRAQAKNKRKKFSILDDLEDVNNDFEIPQNKEISKRRQVSFDLLRELD